MNQKKLISLITLSLLSVGVFTAGYCAEIYQNIPQATIAAAPSRTYTHGDASTYYSSVENVSDANLLASLRTLNSKKRESTVGYSGMGTSTSGMFKYTDYDPNYVQYDSNGMPYGTKCLSFYSGNSMTSWNREHVWPDSRGGNKVEADIHMPRPTIPSENGSRGNSFYVEGKKDQQYGWDPAMETFGDETYRGDSARIIFYCVVANSNFSLSNEEWIDHKKEPNIMGKLADMIKWHLQYAPAQREMNRNEGAEYLQGNRNPFIDHPEYVCRIWGNTNDETRALCQNDPYVKNIPESIQLDKTTVNLKIGETSTISVASSVPEGANKSVAWTSSDIVVASVNEEGLVTANTVGQAVITATSTFDSSVTASCTINVSEPDVVELVNISISASKTTLFEKETSQITVNLEPENIYPKAAVSYLSKDTSVATVSDTGLITGVEEGSCTIEVRATQGSIVKSANLVIDVQKKEAPDYELVNNSVTLHENDSVVLSMNCDTGLGVTGVNQNDKTATVSDNKTSWVHYTVKNISGSTFQLYDPNAKQYIENPGSNNQFTYTNSSSTSVATFTINSDGYIYTGRRYLAKNSSRYRFYTSKYDGAFYVYRTATGDPTPTKELTGINLSGEIIKEYYVGNTFIKPTVIAAYSDGSTADVTSSSIFTGYDMSIAGTQTVTITYKTLSLSYSINVKEIPVEKTLVNIDVISKPYLTSYNVGDTFSSEGLIVFAYYSDSSYKDVSNEVTISTPNMSEPGTKEVRVTYEGKYAVFNIEVVNTLVKVTSVLLSDNELTLSMVDVQTHKLSATIAPSNADNKNVAWSTNNPTVATVSSTGLVTFVAAGDATITVTTEDGGFSDACVFHISNVVLVTGVEISMSKAKLNAGNTLQLEAYVTPEDAFNKSVIWASSDTDVATVNENGLVTAKKGGNTIITVTTVDGDYKDECIITVIGNDSPFPTGSGCNGSIISSSVVLSSLAVIGVTILVYKKKKYEKE